MNAAEQLAIVCTGLFFLTGLITGVIKYQQIMKSADRQAHPYIDICHRSALMYAFASMMLAHFASISQLADWLEFLAMLALMVFFATAILSYLIHGLMQDTDNQLKPPHQLAGRDVSKNGIAVYMWFLIVAETGGFLVLFYGVLNALFA